MIGGAELAVRLNSGIVEVELTRRVAEDFKSQGEIDLGNIIEGNDFRQPWRALAMPAAGPANRMHNRNVGAVTTDQSGGQLARFAQQIMLRLDGCRFLQPPVQMNFRLDHAGRGIDPFAATLDDGG